MWTVGKVSAVVTVLNFVGDSANRDVRATQIVSNSGEYCGFGSTYLCLFR